MIPALCMLVAPSIVLEVGPGRSYASPSAAIAEANNNSAVTEVHIYPSGGDGYVDSSYVDASNLHIIGKGGRPILRDAVSGQKGTFVVRGNNVTIENLEIKNARISAAAGNNAAAVRVEGRDISIIACYFHHNQNGILVTPSSANLGQGTVHVSFTELAYNGNPGGNGREHNIYVNDVAHLEFTFNYSHHAYVGHLVKSRARQNTIMYNRIADEDDGNSSYLLNLPNGGELFALGNVFQQGANSDNHGIIVSYGEEGNHHPGRALFFGNNTVVNDHPSASPLVVRATVGDTLTLRNNLFVDVGSLFNFPGTVTQTTNLELSGPTTEFTDRSARDYGLTETASAIDAGTRSSTASENPTWEYVAPSTQRTRPADAVIDVGAFERSELPTTTTTSSPTQSSATPQDAVNPAPLEGSCQQGPSHLAWVWILTMGWWRRSRRRLSHAQSPN